MLYYVANIWRCMYNLPRDYSEPITDHALANIHWDLPATNYLPLDHRQFHVIV